MGNRRKAQPGATEEEEDAPQQEQELENSVQHLQSMFQAFMVAKQKQEDRAIEDQARQEQRWRGIVHQFGMLQDEVRQERRELGRGRGRSRMRAEQHGFSLSAPVSTAVSPAHATQIGAQAELQRWAPEDQGSGEDEGQAAAVTSLPL